MTSVSGHWQDGVTKIRRGRGQVAGIEAPALGPHGQRHGPAAGGQEGAVGAEIARVLDPEMVAGIREQAADQVEGGLRAGHDHDLLGIAGHAAGDGEVLGDRRAQPRVAAELVVAEQVLPRVPHGGGQQPRPDGEGEARDLRVARMEGDPVGDGLVPGLRRHQAAALGEAGQRRRRLPGARPGGARRQGGDPGPGPGDGVEVALGLERVISRDDGVPAHAQVQGELAARGQARPRGQPAVQDLEPQAVVELAVQRRRRGPVERHHVEQEPAAAWQGSGTPGIGGTCPLQGA